VLLNADAALLLSNKALVPWARRILFGFPANFGNAADKAVVTGNPVRAEILQLPQPASRYASRNGPLNLLIVGGSLGAKVLNDCIPEAIALIPSPQRPRITHQSGKQHIDALRASYARHGVDAEVLAFIDDMPTRYAAADLVICRAGAITVSELTAAGVASVLVPFLASTTTHQRDNAVWMAQQHAAIHLPQSDMTPARVAQLLSNTSREQCATMAQSAYNNGRRDANAAIATILEQLANHDHHGTNHTT
jgi:UDP-N-acetylglucosamine--N-acetylmuramyl-(pentapeptide) pyrophosphoryl-undecaprenol N-acetylglucosamine transferase